MGDLAKAIRSIGGTDLAGGGTYQGTRPQFVPKPPQGKKPAVVGRGRTPASSGGSGANQIEAAFSARTYWTTRNVVSSDGLFVMEVKPVRKVTFQSGATLELADPPP